MIGIYYIATGTYVHFFEGFIKTAKKWMPNEKKVVCLIADKSLKHWDGYKDNGIEVGYNNVTHFPWPTIAMWKFYLMQQNKIDDASLHFYFNANIEFTDNCIDFDYSQFHNGNIVVTNHSEHNKGTNYMQSGSVCIPEQIFDAFCSEHVRKACEYLQRDFRVPEWHDETILNEMLVRDKMFDYKFFDADTLRWHFTNTSPYPNDGLCFLRESSSCKDYTKNMY